MGAPKLRLHGWSSVRDSVKARPFACSFIYIMSLVATWQSVYLKN